MFRYILRRMLAMIPTLLGITLITFLIITCSPGDPVAMQMGGPGGGGGEGGGSGSEAMARRADAIKAKKKLLGMMEPEHSLRVWRPVLSDPELRPDGRPANARPIARSESVGAFPAWARAMAADPAAGRVFAGLEDGSVVAVGAASGEPVAGFRADRFTKPAAAGALPEAADGSDAVGSNVWSLALSADGAKLAAADGMGRIRVLDAATGRTLAEAKPLHRTVRALVFLPAGDALVSGCDDGKIRVHDAATAAVAKELTGHALFVGALAVSKDGRRLWSVGYDRKVREWDLAAGTSVVAGEIANAGNALALSADGKLLAAGGEDRGATVLDVAAAARPAPVVRAFDGVHVRALTALAFTPDGAGLVTGAKDGALKLWRIRDGAEIEQAPDATNGEVHAASFLPDGSLWTASESDRATPIVKRYVTWLGKTVTLDFDRSFVDNERVIDKLATALPITLGLSILTILITYLVAVPVGVAMAARRGQAFDRVASIIVFLLWSLPSFWFATLLIQWFSSRSHWDLFASVGLKSLDYEDLSYLQAMKDRASHLVLPMIVLTYASFTGLSQFMRTSMLEAISQDYVRTARAKGLSERVVIYKHALRNSLVTMVTLVGTMLPALIGGSIIAERIFSIDGMGNLGFEAILHRDYPIIMAVTTMGAVLTLVGMLVSDILYAVVDPRISHS